MVADLAAASVGTLKSVSEGDVLIAAG